MTETIEHGTFRGDLDPHCYATDENTLICQFVSGVNSNYSWTERALMVVTFDFTNVGVHVEPGNHEHNKLVGYGCTQGYKEPTLKRREETGETEFTIVCQPDDNCAFWQPEGASTKAGSRNVNKAESVEAVEAIEAQAKQALETLLKRAAARKAAIAQG